MVEMLPVVPIDPYLGMIFASFLYLGFFLMVFIFYLVVKRDDDLWLLGGSVELPEEGCKPHDYDDIYELECHAGD